jgi:hypothetical protein
MTSRNLLKALLAFLVTVTCAVAEDQVTTLRWTELREQGKLDAEAVITNADNAPVGEEELLIVNETAQPLTVRLAELEPTGISQYQYRVRGLVRYEGVKQPGYLEMWSLFADGGRYFSKTLSSSGPMGVIHGTSSSREFILPFQSSPQSGTPTRLEINLVLPAEGKVWIGPLHVSEFTESEWESATVGAGAWWGNRTGSLVGGVLGSLLGILGAIVGTLSGWGRGKNVCMAICWSTIVFGIVCLIGGLVALTQSQPYVVYFPLLLIGVLSTVVMGSVLRTIRKRFEDVELRRMEAMDVGVV